MRGSTVQLPLLKAAINAAEARQKALEAQLKLLRTETELLSHELSLALGSGALQVPEPAARCQLRRRPIDSQDSDGLISSINRARASLSWSRLRAVSARRNRH